MTILSNIYFKGVKMSDATSENKTECLANYQLVFDNLTCKGKFAPRAIYNCLKNKLELTGVIKIMVNGKVIGVIPKKRVKSILVEVFEGDDYVESVDIFSMLLNVLNEGTDNRSVT